MKLHRHQYRFDEFILDEGFILDIVGGRVFQRRAIHARTAGGGERKGRLRQLGRDRVQTPDIRLLRLWKRKKMKIVLTIGPHKC